MKKERGDRSISICRALPRDMPRTRSPSLLAEQGYPNSMVEIGGEVRTRGEKAGKAPWLIGVQKPDLQGDPIQMAVALEDAALATSG